MTLQAFQQSFWHALWTEAPVPTSLTAQPGFAVYRNTVLKGCADALVSLYPAVHRLTGDGWLRATALDFARRHPPAGGDLQHYGDAFPAFMVETLAVAGPAPNAWPWLADVARLDQLWNESHVAADAPALGLDTLLRRPAEQWARAALVVHPTARWHCSPRWPVFSLWHAARTGADDPTPPHWQGQGALLTRPGGEVQAVEIDACHAALLQCCAEGLPLGAALEAVQARFPPRHPGPSSPPFDPGAVLGHLLHQGAFSGVTEHSS